MIIGSGYDYRRLPSVIPLKSPSPDNKSMNVIIPTISPNVVQIKKRSTPIKNDDKQNPKQCNTITRYQNYSPRQPYSTTIKSKDQIIQHLRHIISIITQNNKQKKQNNISQQKQIKTQLKTLTIQNQKLVNIIDKMNQIKNIKQNQSILSQYQFKINQLHQIIKQKQIYYQSENKKNLIIYTQQLKNITNQKNVLQSENNKLIKILSSKSYIDHNRQSGRYSQNNQNQQKYQQLTSQRQQKLTLLKIRQQHSQNIKLLKQGLIKQIQQTFDTMKIALQGITIKVNGLSQRLQSIQNIIWVKFKKQHMQAQTISPNSKQIQNNQKSYYHQFQRKSKSQIFIDENNVYSQKRVSLSQFYEFDIQNNNKNDIVQQQLKVVKSQLNLQRLIKIKNNQQIHISNKQMIQQQQGNKLFFIKEKQNQIQKIKQIHQKQLNQIKNCTQIQVKLLVQSYQKQIQILKKQLLLKAASLNEANQSFMVERGENSTKLFQLPNKNSIIAPQQNKQQQPKLNNLTYKQNGIAQQNNQQITSPLQNQINQLNEYNKKIEQQLALKQLQLHQKQFQIQSLTNQLTRKNEQLHQLRFALQNNGQKVLTLKDEYQKLQYILDNKQNQIGKLKQNFNQFNNQNMLSLFDQLKNIVIKKQDIVYQQQNNKLSSISQLLGELTKVRQDKQNLKKSLNLMEQSNTQLSAKINELESFNKLTKLKLNEQQAVNKQLLIKLADLQKLSLTLQTQKQQLLIKLSSRVNYQQCLLNKVEGMKQIEQQRLKCIRRFLSYRSNYH